MKPFCALAAAVAVFAAVTTTCVVAHSEGTDSAVYDDDDDDVDRSNEMVDDAADDDRSPQWDDGKWSTAILDTRFSLFLSTTLPARPSSRINYVNNKLCKYITRVHTGCARFASRCGLYRSTVHARLLTFFQSWTALRYQVYNKASVPPNPSKTFNVNFKWHYMSSSY